MDQDLIFMKRALELSRLGASLTHPNPMVGAVVVKNNRIIGEGWHHGPGLPHAEVEALNSCRENPEGATLYVSLEPCNHWGKTPPCTDAVIRAKIAAVKIAIEDCNCQVTGGGTEKLRAAGIRVDIGLCREEALEINRGFFHHCRTGRPWVIMKSAASLDGKIAVPSGESHWITGEPARRMVHQLRSQSGAVLIGSGTLINDDPELTNRLYEPIVRQPLKVLLDSGLKISFENRIIKNTPANLLVFCTERAPSAKVKQLEAIGVRVNRQSSADMANLPAVLDTLGALGIRSVMIEGGSEIFAGFLGADLINEYYLFYAPFFIGGTASKGVVGGAGIDTLQNARRLVINNIDRIGEDILIHAYRKELRTCLPA